MALAPHQESGNSSEVVVAEASSPQLNYSKVQAYWKRSAPSILGPSMMDGCGGRVESFRVGSMNGTRLAHKTVNLYSLSSAIWQEVARRLEHRINAGRVHDYYEVVFAEMAAEGLLPFEAVHFDDGRWCEIDTLDDLFLAEQLFSESQRVFESRMPKRGCCTGGG